MRHGQAENNVDNSTYYKDINYSAELTEKGRELCSIIDLLRHLNAKYDNRKCKTKNCIECELYQSSQL